MKFMLDANVIILLLADNEQIVARAASCFEGEMCMSSIAYAEVKRGIASGTTEWDLLTQAVKAIPVLPFDQAAAAVYSTLPFKRHRFDRLIAAHSLVLGLTLITANPRDFADVPELRVEDWT